MALVFSLGGCATPLVPSRADDGDASSSDLAATLRSLGPRVSPIEAARVAERAQITARKLAQDYRSAGSPHFHNFLVNAGLKKRGLCFHFAEDLTRQLEALQLRTLELHWATARGGTLREHNSVVVTARGKPFHEGIVLDAWRDPGTLFWSPVQRDRYPWQKDTTDYMRRLTNGQTARR